jgi:hypothetical protein
MKKSGARFPSAFRFDILLGVLLTAGLLSSCAGLNSAGLPTTLPADYIPTAVALTLTASGVKPLLPSKTPSASSPSSTQSVTSTLLPTQAMQTKPAFSPSAASTETQTTSTSPATLPVTIPEPSQIIQPTSTVSPTIATLTIQDASPTGESVPDGVTNTPAPAIPDARIQIYRLGDLSKVVSPLDVSLRLTCGDAKIVRIELHGEDGRLLARYVREYKSLPWEAARIGISMDFEISAAAELGRLIVSAEDAFGRTIEVNSMNLILLSQGTTELNPSSGLQQQIIIQDPVEKALIQNGSLIVSGRAHTESLEPLRVMLISEEGKILGQRLAAVTTEIPGDYGQFIAELPYEVNQITNALLVVYEESAPASTITNLTSLNVILVPK